MTTLSFYVFGGALMRGQSYASAETKDTNILLRFSLQDVSSAQGTWSFVPVAGGLPPGERPSDMKRLGER
jgi:hypothetical protein